MEPTLAFGSVFESPPPLRSCALLGLLVLGCASRPDEPSSRRPLGENVATRTEGLNACGVAYVHQGRPPYEFVYECSCPDGYVRDYYNAWNDIAGSCQVSWLSADPTDCRVQVQIDPDPAGATGYCTVLVEAKRPGTGCAGRCGGIAADGACYCDEACQALGDCCSDVVRACTPSASCVNHCNGAAPAGCHCDDDCESWKDCCRDYRAICP